MRGQGVAGATSKFSCIRTICALAAQEGMHLEFRPPSYMRGGVEHFLLEVVQGVLEALRMLAHS